MTIYIVTVESEDGTSSSYIQGVYSSEERAQQVCQEIESSTNGLIALVSDHELEE